MPSWVVRRIDLLATCPRRTAAVAALAIVATTACSRGGAPAPEPAPVAAAAASRALPVDPDLRVDTLPNGLVIYVRRNTEPAGRAELRLAVDAGSLAEAEDQRGLAHFLEHMMFNGTERFPGNDVVSFLERTGMQFGPDINAYTAFDETVYMLRMPTDTVALLERGVDVLEDWAHAATLSPQDVDDERGVIVEEWRLREQNAAGRLRERLLPLVLGGSRYATRLPIGDTAVVRHAPAETIRRFYETWYRPDNMAVVAVGDFEPDSMMALIRSRFGGLKDAATPLRRDTVAVPPIASTSAWVFTDPEQTTTTVQVIVRRAAEPTRTEADFRRDLVRGLFDDMLSQRYAELARTPNPPFVGAAAFGAPLVRTADQASVIAQVQQDGVPRGLEALLTEVERVRQHGFTEGELRRAKADRLRAAEKALAEKAKINSATLAGAYVANFLEEGPAAGVEQAYDLTRRLLPTIAADEVAREAAPLAEGGRLVLVTAPAAADRAPPEEAALARIVAEVDRKPVEPYVDTASDAPLVAAPPVPAAITSRTTIPELGVTDLRLANGVRVLLKPTDFRQDEILLSGTSPGGTSLVPDSLFPAARAASYVVGNSGVGTLDELSLRKRLAGTVVQAGPALSELAEGVSGSASPKDVETMLQLVHLFFTAPRADSAALVEFKNAARAQLANRARSPDQVFQDTLRSALYPRTPRRAPITVATVDSMRLDDIRAVYARRFADAKGWTFTIVGRFDVDSMANLVRTWLGTLPSRGGGERWRDVVSRPGPGIVRKVVRQGEGQRSRVALVFPGRIAPSAGTAVRLDALEGVLDIRLRDELRERRAGVYSPNVGVSLEEWPDSASTVSVSFQTDPGRVDELIAAALGELRAIRTTGPTADELARVKEQLIRRREEQREQNGFWLGALESYGQRPARDPRELLRYPELVGALTPDSVRAAARELIGLDRYIEARLVPAEATR